MYFIGYDIGSSSIKAALVNANTGKRVEVITAPSTEMSMLALKNGWAEQDPDIWWKYVCEATKNLLQKTGVHPKQIDGIGIAYQMHGLVIIDDQDIPIRNSIIWCDSRAVEIGQRAFDDLGNEKCASHLLNSPANFTASKLKWVKDNEPKNYDRIHKFMLPGDYIALKFSGQSTTTLSGLSEGVFWDFKNNTLARELMDYYQLNEDHVPEMVNTFSVQCRVSENGAAASGLLKNTPIMYRAGDQPNNALALNVFQSGEVAATGGTSGVVYAITENMSVKESARVNNFAHVNYSPDLPRIGKLLCINGAGIQYRWLLNNLKVSNYEEMNALAATVQIGSDGVILLPFGNGAERMLDNLDLGTQINHLNLNNHTKAHLCRAALEGIAFSFVYGMEIMKSDGIQSNVLRAGNDNLFRSDIFSNTIATLIGQEIEIYNTTGAIGAARACILEQGNFEAFGKQILDNDYVMSFKPADNKEPYENAYKKWKVALETALKNKRRSH